MRRANTLSDSEFSVAVDAYRRFNESCRETLIFNVGTGAGFYSELGAMLECMLYCYTKRIRFVLYGDNANFSNTEGWNEFFVPFCALDHNQLNKLGNYRFRNHYRWRGLVLPNFFLRRFLFPRLLKRQTGAEYLTQDVFADFTSASFKAIEVDWPEMNIKGTVGSAYAKLRGLAMRFNETTDIETARLLDSLQLPDKYVSVQIRGGDKTEEFDELVDVEFFLSELDSRRVSVTALFVFTDDYRNVEKLRLLRPNWQIFTLTNPDERGYYNSAFNQRDWAFRRKNLFKLFAMVEACIRSDLHFGNYGACVSNFIGSAKQPSTYIELRRGDYRKANLAVYGKSLANRIFRRIAVRS